MAITLGPNESAPWRSQVWLDQEQYPCEHCGAKPGERCRTPNGKRAAYPHAPRFYAYTAARTKRQRG